MNIIMPNLLTYKAFGVLTLWVVFICKSTNKYFKTQIIIINV